MSAVRIPIYECGLHLLTDIGAAQVGSSILGEWAWFLYLVVRLVGLSIQTTTLKHLPDTRLRYLQSMGVYWPYDHAAICACTGGSTYGAIEQTAREAQEEERTRRPEGQDAAAKSMIEARIVIFRSMYTIHCDLLMYTVTFITQLGPHNCRITDVAD